MYWVRLEGGARVRAGVSSGARHAIVRLIAGDQVELKLSPYDPSRGQIVAKR